MAIDDLTSSPPASLPEDSSSQPEKRSRWRRVRGWCSRQWAAIRPGREARRGAIWGTLVVAAVSVIIGGLYIQTGFGYFFDFAFCILFAAILIPLVTLLVMLLLSIARKLPRSATGVIVGSCTIVMLLWGPPQLGVIMAILMGFAAGVLGATIATFFWGNFGQAALSKIIIVSLLFLLALVGNIYFVWLFAHAGSMDKLISWNPPADSMPAKLALPDPSAPGPFHVMKLFYGVGDDIRRPEYGPSVAIKTHTVDSSDFLKDFGG
jgi:hypothetical protein